ncbi:MAG: hypothetical protein ACPLRY_07250 [Candidatus Bathyarchaeales archaeon]
MNKELCKKIFLTVFSALTISLFYMLISSNGLILGNDPAVHLAKAYEMLETGTVSFSEITWYPPLYRILLAEYIVFTGATNIEQALLLIKMLTVTIDWLLVFSVYLLGARLLSEECGIIASFLMLLCFPLYEINFWGGYPSLLTVAYVCLLFFYLPSKKEGPAHKLIIFLIAFSMVLTHQFATFLVSIILVLYALFLLIFRRSFNRLLAIAIVGALAAFLLWYVPIIMPYLDVLIFHVFFRERQYLYSVKYVSLDAFLLNFGFIILFSFFGIILTFYECRKRKELDFFMLLCLGLFVPLLFTQSYLLNLMLPYDRFVYYLMPPAVVFAAAIIYLLAKFAVYHNVSLGRKNLKFYLKAGFTISLIFLLLASRFPVLTGKISEAAAYYSYMDLPGYKASLWLKTHYPSESTVIVTEKPGLFFGLFSSKFTIMETNPTVERATVAETVLNLAYEMENPITLFRVFEARMPYELDQYNVLIHNVWKRASFLYDEETSLSYFENGQKFSVNLSDLERKIFWVTENNCKKLQIQYSLKDKFELTENVEMKSDRLPATVDWVFNPLCREIEDLCINISIHFDLSLLFEKAYVPGMLDWESPWDKPSFAEENGKWALVYFYPKNLTENYVAIYDLANRTFYAVKFADLPSMGSVGVLASKQIDALRLRYDFERVNRTVSFAYSVLNLSEESFQSLSISDFEELFDLKGNFTVQFRDYLTYSEEYGIDFLVFEAKTFRSELLNARVLQLIYSNDEYVICKIR